MKKTFYPTITFLRGIAALMVCLYHFTCHTDAHGSLFPEAGWTHRLGEYGVWGVYIFFVISGFVIPLSLIRHDFTLKRLPRYLARRWIRIEIPYLASLVLVLAIGWLLSRQSGDTFSVEPARIFHHLFYTAPFFGHEWYHPIYWTLAIEMQFYLVLALLFPLMNGRQKLLKLAVPVLFAASSLLLDDYRLIFHYAPVFAQGILLVWVLQAKLPWGWGLPGLLICTMLTWFTHGTGVALISAGTVGLIAFTDLDFRLSNRLGNISYSLYLVHDMVGGTLLFLFAGETAGYAGKWGWVILALLAALAAAWIFWKGIERPSLRGARRLGR